MTHPQPHHVLQRIQDCLNQPFAPREVIEQFLPRTNAEAVTWARRLPGWEEYLEQYPPQAVALARVISRRAMREFSLTLSDDGRVVSLHREPLPWPTPKPSLTFRLNLQGEEVQVEYTPNYFPYAHKDCFYFVNPDSKGHPHCLSDTGHWSQIVPQDDVMACGGPEAYASLLAEARLRGEHEQFAASFEGKWPQAKPPERKKAARRVARKVSEQLPVLGQYTAQALAEHQAKETPDDPPRQPTLFE